MKRRPPAARRGAKRQDAVDARRPPDRAEEGEAALRELRAALANLRAAAEAMAVAGGPARANHRRKRPEDRSQELLSVVVEEADRASRALELLVAAGKGASAARESAASSARRIGAEIARRARVELGFEVETASEPAIEPTVQIAAGPIVEAVLGALARLRCDYAVASVELSQRRHEGLLAFDLAFRAREPEASRLRLDHAALLAGGPAGEPPLGETARSAGGEAWVAVRRSTSTLALRVLLPILHAPA